MNIHLVEFPYVQHATQKGRDLEAIYNFVIDTEVKLCSREIMFVGQIHRSSVWVKVIKQTQK